MSAYSDAVLALNPLFYLRLGEASGTTAEDATANNRDGTYAGGVTLGAAGLIASDPDTAVTLNGGSGKVTVPFGSWMDQVDITIVAWIKTSATGVRLIVDRDGGVSERVFQFRQNGAALEFVKIGGVGASGTVSQATTLNNGALHMVAASFDGSNVRLYKDSGTPIKTQAMVGELFTPSTVNIAVGVNRSPGENAWFSGQVDEVAYFGSKLSDAAIQNLYDIGRSSFIAGSLATETDTGLTGAVSEGLLGDLATETDEALPGTLTVDVEPLYTVTLKVGAHEFTITSDDTFDEDDPIQVLDNLTIGWELDEAAAWPTQPDAPTCTVGFYTLDVAELADVEIGTLMSVVLTDPTGAVFGTFHGRVAEQTAVIVKRGDTLAVLYTLQGVGYTVDLDELPIITEAWPAESGDDRFARIVAAIAAAGGPVVEPPADVDTAAFAAQNAITTNAGDLLGTHLAQVAIPGTYGPQRYIVVPVVVADELDHFECVLLDKTVDAALLPGTFDVVDGLFTLTFPDPAAAGLVDACNVDLSTPWKKLKYRAVNHVTVTGDAFTVQATRPGPPVRSNLSTTLTDLAAGERMAQLYLPDVDETNGWTPDRFRLYAHRAQACIVPSWFPDHRQDPASTAVYVMPIAILGIPPQVNLAGEIVYAGQLSAVQLTISRRKILVDFALRRQLPLGIGDDAASWDWVGTEFPTVTWDDVDPALSWYDARLARSL